MFGFMEEKKQSGFFTSSLSCIIDYLMQTYIGKNAVQMLKKQDQHEKLKSFLAKYFIMYFILSSHTIKKNSKFCPETDETLCSHWKSEEVKCGCDLHFYQCWARQILLKLSKHFTSRIWMHKIGLETQNLYLSIQVNSCQVLEDIMLLWCFSAHLNISEAPWIPLLCMLRDVPVWLLWYQRHPLRRLNWQMFSA